MPFGSYHIKNVMVHLTEVSEVTSTGWIKHVVEVIVFIIHHTCRSLIICYAL